MSLARIWRMLGPGILLAATSIGASHLVLSPQAGARFGTSLLWLVLASHLLKYPAFEFGPRYAAVTGKNLLQGYLKLPGPRGWALWLFLVGTVIQGVGVRGGVVSITGAVLGCWLGGLSAEWYSLVTAVVVVFLLLAGGFGWMDNLNKVMMATLALATLIAFIPACPGPGQLKNLVLPQLPAGSIVLVAAILGWMPTGIDVSIWHSFWTLEKFKRLGIDPADAPQAPRRLRLMLGDMRVGYGLSLISALMFMCMGASKLAGQGEALRGAEFASHLATAYTDVLGPWMLHLFMLTAFFAMFSTSYTVVDGFSRSFAEALASLRGREGSVRPWYVGFVLASSLLAVLTIFLVGNPVTLVTVVALISLAVAPVLYALNIWCVTRHISDKKLRPPRPLVWLACAGVAFMVLAVAVTAVSL